MHRLLVIVHSRFMLGLRGLYFADGDRVESDSTSYWSNINFHGISANIVGNLGATLDLPVGSGFYPEDEAAPAMTQGPANCERGGKCEAEWTDEVPQYCEDPFTTGMNSIQKCDVVQTTLHGSAIQVSRRMS